MENLPDESLMIFNIPNIRNGDGQLILPVHYETELKDNSIVMINVHINLYVFF
jgi:hypothetical protein